MRPWTVIWSPQRPTLNYGLQWGHGLAAVDGWPRSPTSTARPCFNGATALRPWTGHQARGRAAGGITASMGPRPCGRGRRGYSDGSGNHRLASMGPRPCGRGRPALYPRSPPPLTGFNGATALRPWTVVGGANANMLDELQWGHGLAAVDGSSARSEPPRPTSFNGATALRPWTGQDRTMRLNVTLELQWGHGLAAVDGDDPVGFLGPKDDVLQWGHGLAAVDGREPKTFPERASRASMGPRPCGRGRLALGDHVKEVVLASMGPRPCGRGRGPLMACVSHARPCFNGATALRPWTDSVLAKVRRTIELQWGHGLAAVDG